MNAFQAQLSWLASDTRHWRPHRWRKNRLQRSQPFGPATLEREGVKAIPQAHIAALRVAESVDAPGLDEPQTRRRLLCWTR